MTDQEINIVIAEYCGWVKYNPTAEIISSGYAKYPHWTPPIDSKQWVKNWGILEIMSPPSYTTDLNAMAEAEKFLEDNDWNKYTDILGKLCHYNPEIHCLRVFANNIVSSSAKQRADAFVRTINK